MASVRSISSLALIGALIAAVCAAMLFASPAAAVNECDSPGFAQSFDRRFTGCEEVTRIPIRWRGRTAEMVVLKTEGLVLNARSNEVIGHLRDTAARTGDALDEMGGDFEVETIFVMLTEERSAVNGAEAYAFPLDAAYPDQCHVAVFVGTTGSDAGYVTFVMAHELFHCVQMSTWEDGLLLGDNDWWVEGSAEYFANLAFPGTNNSGGLVSDFHSSSATTPLTDLSYENVVFFSWIDQRFGAPRVRAFLQQVAETADRNAARAAAEAALSPDQWLEFAKFYVAGEVQLPGGVDVGPPTDMPSQGADEPLELRGAALVLVRATLNYEAGRYDNLIDRRDGLFAVRHNGEWADLPERLDVECDDQKGYVFAAMSAAADGVNNVITPAQTEERTCSSCAAAAPTAPIRSCLVGTWHYAGHQDFCPTFSERMGAGGARVISCEAGTSDTTFSADGTVTSTAVGQHIVVAVNEDMTLDMDQEVRGTSRWSAEGDTLQICQAQAVLTGSQTIRTAGATRVIPVNKSTPPEDGVATFVCTRTTLTITNPTAFFGIGPEMVLERR